ncbi:hypothetical protein GW830_05395 [bacterium]|nr:hypothetical protein [bacterium]
MYIHEELEKLPLHLKAIADAHMRAGNNEISALKEVKLEQDIEALPDRLKDIADMYNIGRLCRKITS